MIAKEKTFGFVPPSFPRDPVLVNQYDEHVILGQILQPLVDTDDNGRVIPSIAKEWFFEDNGRKIIFEINTDIKFSNGTYVSSVDVAYSLKRHLNSSSQSKSFLENVTDVTINEKKQLVIKLSRKDVSILKVLSRDQLGIIPAGWSFDKNSNIPFVGTGPYSLVKRNDFWFLEKNKFYNQEPVKIETWKLLFFENANFKLPEVLPDLAPDITLGVLNQIKKHLKYKASEYDISPKFGFTQTTFWIHPKSKSFKVPDRKLEIQKFLNMLIADFCKKEGLVRATGLVPNGVQGSLDELPSIQKFEKTKNLTTLKIAVPKGIFDHFFSSINLEKIDEKYGVKIEVFFRSPGELQQMQDWEPDIVAGSWAGAFNDPAGFTSLLVGLVGMNFHKYLGPLDDHLRKSEVEQSFEVRADLFRKLSSAIVGDGMLTPGWRVPVFEFKSKSINRIDLQTRYTPRLVNYKKN